MNVSAFKRILLLTSLSCLVTCHPQYLSINAQRAYVAAYPTQLALQEERLRKAVVYTALQQLGKPYLYGGATPIAGFDCSGLIHYVYQAHGMVLPRTTGPQLKQLVKVSTAQLAPGDLLFFNTGKQALHAGIYLGDKHMLHAPATGRKVTVSDFTKAYWKTRYLAAGRVPILQARAASNASQALLMAFP